MMVDTAEISQLNQGTGEDVAGLDATIDELLNAAAAGDDAEDAPPVAAEGGDAPPPLSQETVTRAAQQSPISLKKPDVDPLGTGDNVPQGVPFVATPAQVQAVGQQMAQQFSFTPAELSSLIAQEVAKALAAKGIAEEEPKGPQSRQFVRVAVTGTYVAMINKHNQVVENFDIEVVMPKGYTMGDLRRSLPNKLARKYPNFKRIRSIDTDHAIVGPAHANASTGEVESDYIAPAKVVATKENTEGDDTPVEGEPGVGTFGDTTEYGSDGLPPIINA